MMFKEPIHTCKNHGEVPAMTITLKKKQRALISCTECFGEWLEESFPVERKWPAGVTNGSQE